MLDGRRGDSRSNRRSPGKGQGRYQSDRRGNYHDDGGRPVSRGERRDDYRDNHRGGMRDNRSNGGYNGYQERSSYGKGAYQGGRQGCSRADSRDGPRDHPRGDRRQDNNDRYKGKGGWRDDRRDNYQDNGNSYEKRWNQDQPSKPQRGKYVLEYEGDRPRSRSPHGNGGEMVGDGPGKVPIGRYKITIENVPDDMSWLELKDLGREYGSTLTFARTYRHKNRCYGMLEFKEWADADRAVNELHYRRVQGSRSRLQAYHGAGPGG